MEELVDKGSKTINVPDNQDIRKRIAIFQSLRTDGELKRKMFNSTRPVDTKLHEAVLVACEVTRFCICIFSMIPDKGGKPPKGTREKVINEVKALRKACGKDSEKNLLPKCLLKWVMEVLWDPNA